MRLSKPTIISIVALLAILIGIPLALITHEAGRTGQTVMQYLKRAVSKGGPEKRKKAEDMAVPGEKIDFLKKSAIGDSMGDTKPWITHLKVVDLDKDGLKDVVVCDAKRNQVSIIWQRPKGTYTEKPIGSQVRGPAHATPFDIDNDGDLDLLIAKMGMIFPNNDKIGAVVVLENKGGGRFENRVLADGIARVTDVEAGDLDGDGDIDLAVGQFGYDDGEIRWMENKGNWVFDSHNLLNLSGTIHTPVCDIDHDGDLDIVALVSQEWEEIYVFINDGKGNFEPKMIYGSTNEDFGSSGISTVDMDKDGDLDILYTNGDAFDYIPPGPRPWHGVQWLENKGGVAFDYHRIGDFPGAYFANAVDVDNDGDLDVAVVSGFNQWDDPAAQSMIWFENDGKMGFKPHDLASVPTHLLVLDTADMDGDGWVDFVTGGMHAYPPFDRMSRVTLWQNRWPNRKTDGKAP
ncbi:MAG: VCBS repeat-containing protein [Deltaproteobacteria bacterium]|nr:VCBS repeat-containing protein [Deltaproteobacteria bacterium]